MRAGDKKYTFPFHSFFQSMPNELSHLLQTCCLPCTICGNFKDHLMSFAQLPQSSVEPVDYENINGLQHLMEKRLDFERWKKGRTLAVVAGSHPSYHGIYFLHLFIFHIQKLEREREKERGGS